MFANSRTASVNGWTMKYRSDLDRDQDDQDPLRHVPGDHVLEVAAEALVLDAQVQVGQVDHGHQRTGNAIRDMAGNWESGMISIRFMTQMKKNSDTRNGR